MARRTPRVVIFSGAGVLAGVDAPLRQAGVRVVRVRSLDARPVPSSRWLVRFERTRAPDLVLVTSSMGVTAGIRPWTRKVGARARVPEYWAVGPATAAALRRAGIRRVHRSPEVGAAEIIRSLQRRRRSLILYFRSDLAGPGLARALRGRGHRVIDCVAYRVVETPALSPRSRRLISGADLLVITSPSGLETLRRRFGPATFARLARELPVVVLGVRSQRTARRLGVRRATVAPSLTAQRFTRHILEELRHAAR